MARDENREAIQGELDSIAIRSFRLKFIFRNSLNPEVQLKALDEYAKLHGIYISEQEGFDSGVANSKA